MLSLWFPRLGYLSEEAPTPAVKISSGAPTLHVHSVEKDSVVFDTELSFGHMQAHTRAYTHIHTILHTSAQRENEGDTEKEVAASVTSSKSLSYFLLS